MTLTTLSDWTDAGRIAAVALVLGLATSGPAAAVTQTEQPARSSKAGHPPDNGAIVHTLNRLTWGPRPGDVEKVRAMGLESWIEAQLHPGRIDDRALEVALRSFETYGLSSAELVEGYNPPREVRQAVQKMRADLSDDATEAELIAVRFWNAERDLVRDRLAEHGIAVAGWRAGEPLDLVLSELTRRRHRAARAGRG